MKTEKSFYDIISSKFSNRQIPFEEQDWQSMRKMLDDSRAEKKRTMWLVLSLCLLLFSGAAFGLYEWNSNAGAAHPNMAANNNGTSSSGQTITGANKQTNGSGSSSRAADNKTTNNPADNSMSSDNGATQQNQPAINVAINAVGNSTKINDKKYVTKSHHKKNATVNNGSEPIVSIAKTANSGNNSPAGMSEDNPSSGKGIASAVSSGNVSMPSNAIAVKTTSSLSKTSSHRADSAAAGDALPQRFSDEPRVFQGKTNIFSVEAGGEYSFGWAVSADGTMTQGQGANPIVGIGFEHYMGSKLFLKTGLQFSTFGNMHTSTYDYQHSVGNVIYDSVITTQRLYFLRIPLQAEYFIGPNKKSCIGAGGSVWFLLGNSGYATTYQQPENTPPQNVVQYSKNASLNGYTKVDFSGQVFYRYMINPKFSVYAIIYSEFTSMREKSFFGGNVTDNTRGMQFTLSYNLN